MRNIGGGFLKCFNFADFVGEDHARFFTALGVSYERCRDQWQDGRLTQVRSKICLIGDITWSNYFFAYTNCRASPHAKC
jgi:hypothetical protein